MRTESSVGTVLFSLEEYRSSWVCGSDGHALEVLRDCVCLYRFIYDPESAADCTVFSHTASHWC